MENRILKVHSGFLFIEKIRSVAVNGENSNQDSASFQIKFLEKTLAKSDDIRG